VGSRSTRRRGELGELDALANHPVLEMTDLEDAFRRRGRLFGQLEGFKLEELLVHGGGAGGEEDLDGVGDEEVEWGWSD